VCEIALIDSLGKKARVSKDSYGFVVNRVLIPMINETINCVHEGLASPEDIDVIMKLGANHAIGPLSLADLIGLDVVWTSWRRRDLTIPNIGRAHCLSKCVTPVISDVRRAVGSLRTLQRDRCRAGYPPIQSR
jgi:3-hydroxyacyl-CoA dehydrogenase